jgi:hypothetical protein
MATPKTPSEFIQEDEISLKDIIAEIVLWINLVKKNILWLIFLGLLGGATGFAYAYFSIPTYNAKLNFVLKSDANPLSSSLSSLTRLLGTGSSSAGSSLERIVELISSDRIVGYALLKTREVDGKSDLLINHYIHLEKLKEEWAEDTVLNKVQFKITDNQIDQLNFSQRKAMKIISRQVIAEEEAKGMVEKSFNKKSGVVKLMVTYKNERFAIELSKAIYQELVTFYIDQTLYTANNNVSILTKKVDSIRNALSSVQRSYAQQSDQSLGLLLQEDKVDLKSLAVKEQLLTIMYGEATKNLETVKFMQASAMPSLLVIDSPYPPIKPVLKSKILYTLIGLLFPTALLLFSLRIRMYVANALA